MIDDKTLREMAFDAYLNDPVAHSFVQCLLYLMRKKNESKESIIVRALAHEPLLGLLSEIRICQEDEAKRMQLHPLPLDSDLFSRLLYYEKE